MSNTYKRLFDLVVGSDRTDEVSQARISKAMDKRDETDAKRGKEKQELRRKAAYHAARGDQKKSNRASSSVAAIQDKLDKSNAQVGRVFKKARLRKDLGVYTDPKDKNK